MAKYDIFKIVDSIYEGTSVKKILEKHAYDPHLIKAIDNEIERRKRAGEIRLKKEKRVIVETVEWKQEEDGSMKFMGIKRS